MTYLTSHPQQVKVAEAQTILELDLHDLHLQNPFTKRQ